MWYPNYAFRNLALSMSRTGLLAFYLNQSAHRWP